MLRHNAEFQVNNARAQPSPVGVAQIWLRPPLTPCPAVSLPQSGTTKWIKIPRMLPFFPEAGATRAPIWPLTMI
jgi:hypothetical protein